MGRLMFECPDCKREFSSDIHTDANSMRQVLDRQVRVTCPHCGTVHEMSMKRGRLEEADLCQPVT